MSGVTFEGPLKGPMLWMAAVVLAAANFIAVLDMTVANVSVPNIAGSLGISSSLQQARGLIGFSQVGLGSARFR